MRLDGWLAAQGRVFAAWRTQDSGCVSYGLELRDGSRAFVKQATTTPAHAGLERAWALHATVRHPALVAPRERLALTDGLALVYPWVAGEVLYETARFTSAQRLTDPRCASVRFRALAVAPIEAALAAIYDAHLALSAAGFVAVDFYDGCVMYDFSSHETRLIDLDEYRPGPFVVEGERLPGSRRFMPPEAWTRGATIDESSTVYTLGRTALELLGDGTDSSSGWRASAARLEVVRRATRAEHSARWSTVGELVGAWRAG